MNPLQELGEYVRKIERNVRMLWLARGMAILCGAALLVTFALVLVMNRFSFSDPSVFVSRLLLFFALAAALTLGVILPLLRLNTRRVARETERRHPELGERLLTFVERRRTNDPFLPLMAAEALPLASRATPQAIAAPSISAGFGVAALLLAASLVWLGNGGPGYLRYGTSLLWGLSTDSSKPFYSITVTPGDHRVRRHADQLIGATLNGFFSHQASLFVRYASATRWEETPMRPQPDGAAFQFLLVGIPEDVEYYVVSNGVRSATEKLTAVDLPKITHLRVRYHFPQAYGLPDQQEDLGGDLRALRGTVADLEVQTDKPLSSGVLVLDTGKRVNLDGSDGRYHASVTIDKDGSYHFAAPDGGELVRLSDDYFIEARADSPPRITILSPNRDARVTPIEEVPVTLQASDDNGVNALDLHYSVNGGPEQVRSLLHAKGTKDAHGNTILALEDFKLVPGDIVSLYATAKDAVTTARSDIYFVEARPFELDYHQDQASGDGSMGGGQDQQKIAERQKEIIAATFNQIKDEKHDGSAEAENAKYLSGVQAKLRDEAQSLADRMKARQIASASTAFQQFVINMESAVGAMSPAADQLRGQHWRDALSPEQKALQYLLRAEAIFRDIQIQISRGGGGGGAGGASRDLEGLTNLELDTQKNQYESGSQSAADQQQKEADEALKKLEELAKRQQQLAQQQQSQQNFQQRWEQEMLRREAEQLRRKLEDLARQNSGQGPSQQKEGQQGQQGSESQAGQQGSQQAGTKEARNGRQSSQASGSQSSRFTPGTREALEQAIRNLTEATRNMGEAASHGQQSQAERAANELNRAQSALSAMRRDQTGSQMSSVIDQARKLAEKQSDFDSRLRKNFAGGAAGDRSEQQNAQLSGRMADEKRREIEDLHQLERSLAQATRGMQNTQPDAAKKLRDAIGEMQQNEIESRMKWTAEALNKGMGSYAVMREAPVTRALSELKDQLAAANDAMGAGAGKPDDRQAMEQALARAEKLRRDLQHMSGKSGERGAPQEGSQQAGGKGQQGSGKEGDKEADSSRGETGDGSADGVRSGTSARGGFGPVGPAGGGTWDAMNPGTRAPDAARIQQEYEQAVRELSRLEQGMQSQSQPATAKEMQNLLRELQGLNPRRFGADPARLSALEGQIVAEAEQAELLLRRALEAENGSIRTTKPNAVPPGYEEAVADYFRKLSH